LFAAGDAVQITSSWWMLSVKESTINLLVASDGWTESQYTYVAAFGQVPIDLGLHRKIVPSTVPVPQHALLASVNPNSMNSQIVQHAGTIEPKADPKGKEKCQTWFSNLYTYFLHLPCDTGEVAMMYNGV
jgi:hypothetical protein